MLILKYDGKVVMESSELLQFYPEQFFKYYVRGGRRTSALESNVYGVITYHLCPKGGKCLAMCVSTRMKWGWCEGLKVGRGIVVDLLHPVCSYQEE